MLLLLVLPLVLPLAPAASLLSAACPDGPALQPVEWLSTLDKAGREKNLVANFEICNDIFTTPREQGCGNDDRGDDGRA